MNIAQAGYHMLMILSVVDGHYSATEGKVIVDYLMKNYQLDIDIDKENQVLLGVEKDKLPEHFKKSAEAFNESSNEEQRLDFIVFAYRLVQADGAFAAEENKILTSLANYWNVDIEPLLNENTIPEELSIKDWGSTEDNK
jgi:uncharacterized tellurite resistance protein B-like protein